MNTFNNLKTIATLKRKTSKEIMTLADIFLMNNRITADEYKIIYEICDSESDTNITTITE